MKNIRRINIYKNTVDTITVFDSELTRWFDAKGIDIEKNLIKINSIVPSGKDSDVIADDISIEMQHYAACGFELDNVTYRPFMAAASDVRKGTSTWVSEQVYADLFKWAMCGLNKEAVDGKIAINKFMAYIGLLASASHPFEEIFGRKINVRRVAVIKDGEVSVDGVMDVVNNSVEHNVNRTCVINAFDGFAAIRSELTNGESCTLRGPWVKAFAQAVKWNSLSAFGLRNGCKTFTDFWGNEVSLKDVDVILTASCFKAVKLFSSWKQYCDAFEALEHCICVCVREHAPKEKGMPYQQGQTLLGSEQDAADFAAFAASTVEKYSNASEAASLLPKGFRSVAKVYPAIMKEAYTSRVLQEKYTSKRVAMLGGRTPELGFNAFIAPDVVAFAQHLFDLNATGSLKAGECACSNCAFGDVDITRNPHFDNAHVIMNNVGLMDMVPAKSPTMFINVLDLTTIQLRADYDGDHVWYSQNEMLLALVKKTINEIGASAVDWDVASAPKSKINKSTIAGFVSHLLKGSEIGIYADALTKMWANGYDRDTCNWLTYAGNVLIDAAKHASTKVQKPANVKALDNMPLPMFARYAKADIEHPATSSYWDEEVAKNVYVDGKKTVVSHPRTAYTGSFMDMYSRKVNETVSETLTVKGLDDVVFDPHMLLVNPLRKFGKLAGLSRKGKKFDVDTQTYTDSGVFQQIAFRHAAEWKKLLKVDEDITMNRIEWEHAKQEETKRELIAWARAQYPEVKVDDEAIWTAVYDIVTRNVFSVTPNNASIAYDDCIKREYWIVFGDKAAQVVADKIGEAVLDSFDEEWEDVE